MSNIQIVRLTIKLRIKIKDLFKRYNIQDLCGAYKLIKNQVKVLSPIGYKYINYLFRTLKQQKIKIILLNNKYIICGLEHKLKCNHSWVEAKDIKIDDILINKLIFMLPDVVENNFIPCRVKVKAIVKVDKDELILYDILVDLTHSYYANDIWSHNSWFLAGIGAEALKQNKKVLHYTLLLSDSYTYMRYDSILSKIPFQKLLLSKDKVKGLLLKYLQYTGNLRVKYYPTKGANVGMLLNHIKQCLLLLKFKPDLIIIDYADLLKPDTVYDNSYHTIGLIYLHLRGLAGLLQVPVWSASQINRAGSNKLVIDKEDLSLSYKKILIADFAFAISRMLSDKVSLTARITIMKNRFGPDGLVYNADMDASIGKIDIYDSHTLNSVKAKEKMQNGDKVIANKISERLAQLKVKQESGE